MRGCVLPRRAAKARCYLAKTQPIAARFIMMARRWQLAAAAERRDGGSEAAESLTHVPAPFFSHPSHYFINQESDEAVILGPKGKPK